MNPRTTELPNYRTTELPSYRTTELPAFSSHRHKPDRQRLQDVHPGFGLSHDLQFLDHGADRDRHQPADLQLFDQGGWHGVRRGGHHDAVEGRLVRPAGV